MDTRLTSTRVIYIFSIAPRIASALSQKMDRTTRRGYKDTYEFDVVVVFIILVVIPTSIFLMQSKRSKGKRYLSFFLLGASFLWLIFVEGIVRLRETERASEVGLKGLLVPERMMGGGAAVASRSRSRRKRKGPVVMKRSSSFSEKTDVFTSEKKKDRTTLRYFSLLDAPSEREETFRNERIRASREMMSAKPIIVHVEQKFSGGDAFFREAFSQYEREDNVKTARVSSDEKSAVDDDVGTVSFASDGSAVVTPQTLKSIFPDPLSIRTVFVVRDPRDVITASYLSIISTLEEWARAKRDDLDGSSFQSVMRNKLNAETALDLEIARFMSASADVPFFSELENAMTAEIEKSNGNYANAILSFAEAMLVDSGDETIQNTTIFVKYADFFSANATGFRKLSEFLRGDATLERVFLAAAASLKKRAETEPSLIASLVSKNDDTFYRHKKNKAISNNDEIITPPNVYKVHFTQKNEEHFALLGQPLLRLLFGEDEPSFRDDDDDNDTLFADFDAVDGAILNPWKK